MKTARSIPKPFKRVGFYLSLAALFVGVASLPSLACGFHTQFFRGEFSSDWATLKPSMTDRSQRQQVITELLSILHYVDTYNYAPDSPPWMETEQGRTNARESAVEILHELGDKAADMVWEALANDIRFDTPETRKALLKVRVERDKVQEIENDLRVFLSKKFSEVFKKINAAPSPREADDELLRAWTEQGTRLGIGELPKPMPEAPSSDGKIHRRVPQRMFTYVRPYSQTNLLQSVQVDPLTASDLAVRNFIRRHSMGQASLAAAVLEYNRIVGKQKPQFGAGQMGYLGGDLVPCEEFRSDLETVLVRIGKAALPMLERGSMHPHKAVAAKAELLVKAINAQAQPVQPTGLKQDKIWEVSVRRAHIALEIWDLSDKRIASPIAARALNELKARGLEVYADVLALHHSKKLDMQREVITALEKLSGEKLGHDLAAWVTWHGKRLEAERNKPLPKELSPEDLIIAPTHPDPASELPKQKTADPVDPPPETPDENAKPDVLDRHIKKTENGKTQPPAPVKTEPKTTELEDEKPGQP